MARPSASSRQRNADAVAMARLVAVAFQNAAR
jgi:hypothetical protein